jgi:hypothetical protein
MPPEITEYRMGQLVIAYCPQTRQWDLYLTGPYKFPTAAAAMAAVSSPTEKGNE